MRNVDSFAHVSRVRNRSDQSSSIEPAGLLKLVKGIRDVSAAIKYEPQERIQFEAESIKKESLRPKK